MKKPKPKRAKAATKAPRKSRSQKNEEGQLFLPLLQEVVRATTVDKSPPEASTIEARSFDLPIEIEGQPIWLRVTVLGPRVLDKFQTETALQAATWAARRHLNLHCVMRETFSSDGQRFTVRQSLRVAA